MSIFVCFMYVHAYKYIPTSVYSSATGLSSALNTACLQLCKRVYTPEEIELTPRKLKGGPQTHTHKHTFTGLCCYSIIT